MIPDNTAYELAQHLAREEENDRRAEERQAMIEERANELMQEGGDCFPFTLKNIFEALGNLNESSELVLATFISAAALPSANDYLQQLAGQNIVRQIREYWQSVALVIAEKEVRI